MMTLLEVKPIAQRPRGEADIDTTAVAAIGPDTPMACESYVADAVCHLLSGLLLIKDLAAASQPVSGPKTPLECSCKNIATVLTELNNCSVGFWSLPRTPVPPVARLRGWCVPSKRRRRAPLAGGELAVVADNVLEVKTPRPSDLHAVPLARTKAEWGNSLALAILHLVGAYKAMETLSESPFPAGAPEPFELACHCLCAALVTLDVCLADCQS
jgi:hypothetical protein